MFKLIRCSCINHQPQTKKGNTRTKRSRSSSNGSKLLRRHCLLRVDVEYLNSAALLLNSSSSAHTRTHMHGRISAQECSACFRQTFRQGLGRRWCIFEFESPRSDPTVAQRTFDEIRKHWPQLLTRSNDGRPSPAQPDEYLRFRRHQIGE